MKKIGFIGCGNMGGALASAVLNAVGETKHEYKLYFADRCAEKASALVSRSEKASLSLPESIAMDCDYIFLGVKPQGFDELFSGIGGILRSRSDRFVLVSMAAGISVAAIEKYAGCGCGVIRIMPNTPVSVGQGMILYDCNAKVNEEEEETFRFLLSRAGLLDRLPEEKIDAASALSGCGPAFVDLFAEALADGAVDCGLPRDKANLYAAQMLLGSAKLLLESGKHPGELKDAVCSPGGTTIEGVRALEEGEFRASVMNAVIAAYEKTLRLKK